MKPEVQTCEAHGEVEHVYIDPDQWQCTFCRDEWTISDRAKKNVQPEVMKLGRYFAEANIRLYERIRDAYPDSFGRVMTGPIDNINGVAVRASTRNLGVVRISDAVWAAYGFDGADERLEDQIFADLEKAYSKYIEAGCKIHVHSMVSLAGLVDETRFGLRTRFAAWGGTQ